MDESPEQSVADVATSTFHGSLISSPELVTKAQKAFLMPLLITIVTITGTTTLIFVQWASFQATPICGKPDCPVKGFDAPLLQLVIQTYGETLCLGVHMIDKYICRRLHREHGFLDFPCASDDIRERTRWVNWIVPAVCDCAATLLLLFAITSTAASTVQLLRNTQVIVCAFVSICWLGRNMRAHAWMGVVVLTIGLLITATSQIRNGNNVLHAGKNPVTGVVLTLSSTVMSSFCLVFVEHLYKRFRCSPFEAVGYMGLISLVIALVAMLIAHWARIERIDQIWYQVLHARTIGTAMGLYLMSVALFNGAALALIKIGSALLTSVVFSSRQTLIWIVEMCLGWKQFDWADFAGMITVLFSLLIYAGVFVCNCWPSVSRFQMKEVQLVCHCIDADDDEEEGTGEDDSHARTTYTNSGLSDCNPAPAFSPAVPRAKRASFPKIIMTGHEQSFLDDGQELWIYVEKEVQYTQVDRPTSTAPSSARLPPSPSSGRQHTSSGA